MAITSRMNMVAHFSFLIEGEFERKPSFQSIFGEITLCSGEEYRRDGKRMETLANTNIRPVSRVKCQ